MRLHFGRIHLRLDSKLGSVGLSVVEGSIFSLLKRLTANVGANIDRNFLQTEMHVQYMYVELESVFIEDRLVFQHIPQCLVFRNIAHPATVNVPF